MLGACGADEQFEPTIEPLPETETTASGAGYLACYDHFAYGSGWAGDWSSAYWFENKPECFQANQSSVYDAALNQAKIGGPPSPFPIHPHSPHSSRFRVTSYGKCYPSVDGVSSHIHGVWQWCWVLY